MGYLRSLIDALAEWVADLDRLGLLCELGEEFVVDLGLDKDTSTSATSLAVVPADWWSASVDIRQRGTHKTP